MSENAPVPILGQDILTERQITEKAATYLGLKVRDSKSRNICSEAIAIVPLDKSLLTLLKKRGFVREPRPDSKDLAFTLSDTNPTTPRPGWAPSNYWNFKKDAPAEIKLSLCLSFYESMGYVLVAPLAQGNFLSPIDPLPNFRMFQAVIDHGTIKNLPEIALKIANCAGAVRVYLRELGLEGAKNLLVLFEEFCKGNEEVWKIAERKEVFDPLLELGLFATLEAQPKIILNWRNQLLKYKNSLAVIL